MPTSITPDLFIATLAAMLEVERERKTERTRTQNRAKVMQFLRHYSPSRSDDLVEVDTFCTQYAGS